MTALKGTFIPPGDKSISHRAVMFGALAEGTSRYQHFLEGEDCLSSLNAFRSMGVKIDHERGTGEIVIHGVGLRGLQAPEGPIDMGNSGTSMRLIMGILAGQKMEAVLTGDESLSKRPMKRVTQPLKQMGAQIKGADNGNFAPLTIRGGKLKAIDYENKLGSAQVKSAILLAGLYAEGQTRVREFIASRDHTERFLKSTGANFKVDGEWLQVMKTESLKPFEAEIPGDMSAAAFFITAAAMIPGSELVVEKVSLNPTRTGFLSVLSRMGAILSIEETQVDPEPLGRVTVRGGVLKGTRITKDEIPSLIDEIPILMTAMAVAQGESLISGAEELRVKETDRIDCMVKNLTAIGADLDELPDGALIRGIERFEGGEVDSFGDHRTAMSMAIAGLVSQKEVKIKNTDCVAISFPSFFEELTKLTV